MDEVYKEVEFDSYCPKCKHFKKLEEEDPCFDCMNEPLNLYSHRPVKYEKESKRKGEE